MKLSTLVEHRNTVAAVNFNEYDAFAKKVFDVQCMLDDYNTTLSHGAYNQIRAESILIDGQVENMHTTIEIYLATLNAQIKELEPSWLEASQLVYNDIKYDDAEWTLDRLRKVEHHRSVDASNHLLSRISAYPSWEHAAMQIHPGFGFATELLKGTDPLYLVDTRDDLFTTVRNKWNPLYQNRLRYYTIDEFSDTKRFSALPAGQFGFILALDFFTYRTIDVIEEYLTEMNDLLKPGGVVMFTFNNCDTIQGCRLIEHKFACYSTEKMVRSIIDKLGYEVLHFYVDEECGTSWFEIKKPGELTTLRGGQTISQIKSI